MGRPDVGKDNFYVYGSTHLTPSEVDWNNEEHRRCIAACLVKGTYLLESEHQTGRTEGNLAPAWWETFHFRLHGVLASGCNCVGCKKKKRTAAADVSSSLLLGTRALGRSCIYGAVFKYVPPAAGSTDADADADDAGNRHPSSAPHYVVAFRGTMPRGATFLGDMRLNLRVLVHKQSYCGRFSDARRHVTSLLALDSSTPAPPAAAGGRAGTAAGGTTSSSSSNSAVVWLAGHSLGASIALDVGRDMAITTGCNLPTFLFNPPHVSAAPAIDAVMPEDAKRGLYKSSYVLKCALGIAMLRSHMRRMEQLFGQLSPWVPNLYVHRKDAICNGFIDYFRQREQVKKWSARVASPAATLSYRDMAYSVFRKQSERQHLLPCAVMWTTSHGDDPHGLRQWWRPTGPELDLRRDEYNWPLISTT